MSQKTTEIEFATYASLEINKISESIITNSTKRPRVESSSSPEQHLTMLQVIIVIIAIQNVYPVGN